MTLQELVTTLETSRKLVEAGVSIPTLFYHKNGSHITRENYMVSPPSYQQGCTPAFTAQELSEYCETYYADGVIELAVQDFFGPYSPASQAKPLYWAEFILSLITKQIITPK